MIRISKKYHTYKFNINNKPVATVSVGDKVLFETIDCWSGNIKKEEDVADFLDPSTQNPNTGHIFIKGTEPGDILAIKILDIVPVGDGILSLVPNEGKLRQYVKAPFTKIVKIENGKTIFSKDLVINNKPHVGTIGATPIGRMPTGIVGEHGGNIDCPEATIGATLYFPVYIKGALFQMGDVHAHMGEGEMVTGVECGAEVTVEILKIIKGRFIPAPMIEDEEYWYILANATTQKEANRIAAKRMADFLSLKLDLPLEESYLLASIAGNLRVAQDAEAGYNVSVYVQFPKYIDKKGRLNEF